MHAAASLQEVDVLWVCVCSRLGKEATAPPAADALAHTMATPAHTPAFNTNHRRSYIQYTSMITHQNSRNICKSPMAQWLRRPTVTVRRHIGRFEVRSFVGEL